jgi:hypothetical protein
VLTKTSIENLWRLDLDNFEEIYRKTLGRDGDHQTEFSGK